MGIFKKEYKSITQRDLPYNLPFKRCKEDMPYLHISLEDEEEKKT